MFNITNVNKQRSPRDMKVRDTVIAIIDNFFETNEFEMCIRDRVTFLRDDFEKFAKDHVKLRVLSGPFKDFEVFLMHATDSYSSSTEVEDELAVTVYADNVRCV